MKSDLQTAIAQIAAERGIPREAVQSSVEHALENVYRKMANTEEPVEARMDAIASSRPAIPSCPGPAPARHSSRAVLSISKCMKAWR